MLDIRLLNYTFNLENYSETQLIDEITKHNNKITDLGISLEFEPEGIDLKKAINFIQTLKNNIPTTSNQAGQILLMTNENLFLSTAIAIDDKHYMNYSLNFDESKSSKYLNTSMSFIDSVDISKLIERSNNADEIINELNYQINESSNKNQEDWTSDSISKLNLLKYKRFAAAKTKHLNLKLALDADPSLTERTNKAALEVNNYLMPPRFGR